MVSDDIMVFTPRWAVKKGGVPPVRPGRLLWWWWSSSQLEVVESPPPGGRSGTKEWLSTGRLAPERYT